MRSSIPPAYLLYPPLFDEAGFEAAAHEQRPEPREFHNLRHAWGFYGKRVGMQEICFDGHGSPLGEAVDQHAVSSIRTMSISFRVSSSRGDGLPSFRRSTKSTLI